MASPCPAADRNLLFGILALQLCFINRDRLVAAMNAWVLDKHKPLGQVLAEQGALAADHHELLEALVQKHLALHDGDAQRSLASVSSLSSLQKSLEQIADPDVQASLVHVSARPQEDPDATSPQTAGTPTSSGLRYRILRPHARGGLGEVYVARDMELNREIALKEIQPQHSHSPDSRGRFLLEAEVTGGLEHPGIVPVYGLGTYADGRPFYAMRFIKGDNLKEAIARFHSKPRDESLSPAVPAYTSLEFRQLLGRFVDVCNAVAYAHSRGVLHRDIKPGNIMLGKFGETLVVDWGLAKVVGRTEPQASAEGTLLPSSGSGVAETQAGSAIGTPSYMSPEQAAGKVRELGPAADVYSLGATLYTLLTNQPPVRGSDVGEVLRKVQRGKVGFDHPAPPPAAQASLQSIPRPLMAVCRKAMSLNPNDRYATPLSLAADVENWLADEPVSATPEPWTLRARRWMRRHPGTVSGVAASLLVGLVGVVLGALLLGEKNRELSGLNESLAAANSRLDQANTELTGSNLKLDQANQKLKTTNEKLELARQLAEKAAAAERLAAEKERKATAVATTRLEQNEKANELIESIFRDIDPRAEEKGGPLLLEQLTRRLLETADKLDEAAIGDPLTVARLQTLLGNTLLSLGEPGKAIALNEKARNTRERLLGPVHFETLISMNNLARSYQDAGKLELALPLFEETLKLRKAKLGSEHPSTLNSMHNLAHGYRDAGKLGLALPLFEETLKIRKTSLGPEHPNTLISMNSLATGYQDVGKLGLALPLWEETLKLSKARLGPEHPDTLGCMHNLARGYHDAGKLDLALPLLEETFKLRKARLGLEHPSTLSSMSNLAHGYRDAGKPDLALSLFQESLKLSKARLGLEHPNTLTGMNNLAISYQDVDRLELALPLLEETLKLRKVRLSPEHPHTLISMLNLAGGYKAAGKLDLALPLFEETLKLMKARLGPEHPDTLVSMGSLADGYRDAKKLDLALSLFEETLKMMKARLGPEHPRTLTCMMLFASGFHDTGKLDLATPLYEETHKLMKVRLGPEHPSTLTCICSLARAYHDARKLELALPLYEETLKLMKARLGPKHTHTLFCMGNLAKGYHDAGKLDLAIPLYEETFTLMKAKFGPEHTHTVNSMNSLALGYRNAGKLDLALPIYQEMLKHNKAKLGLEHPDTLTSIINLVEDYDTAGKLDLALPLLEETLKLRKARLGADHPDTLTSMNTLARGYHDAGKLDLALPLYEETLKFRKAKLGPEHPDTLISMNNLAECYRDSGKLDLALPLHEETLKLSKARLGHEHPDTLNSMSNLAISYQDAGKLDLALPLLEETLKLRKARLGPEHPRTLLSMNNLAWAYQDAGKLELALRLYQETLKLRKARLGSEHPDTLISMENLANAFLQTGTPEKATPVFDELVAAQRKRMGPGDPRFTGLLARVSSDLFEAHQFPAAEKLLRECLALRTKSAPGDWSTFNTRAILGASLLGQKNYKDSEPLLLEGYDGMKAREKTIPPAARPRLREAAERLVELYEATSRPEEAKKWTAVVLNLDGVVDETLHEVKEAVTLKGELNAETPHRIYRVRLQAGMTYLIDLVSPDGKALDPYLQVRDEKRKVLAEDDDGGGMLNARLTFRAAADGVYQLRATSFNAGRGPFTLTIRTK